MTYGWARMSVLVCLLAAVVAGCRYFDVEKTVDYVIAGDAGMAGKGLKLQI